MKLFWCTSEWFGGSENRLCIANNKEEAIGLVTSKVHDEIGRDEPVRVTAVEVTKLLNWQDNCIYKILLEKE